MSEHRQHWQLDPDCIYLNHGSFGPSPTCVRNARREWTERLEQQPMRFFLQEMEEELRQTSDRLAQFLGTDGRRLGLVENSTMAMNIAAASIPLTQDDVVLLTNHEYGAVRNIWQSRCRAVGATLKVVRLPSELTAEQIVPVLSDAVTDDVRVLVCSHVTSPTAVILPIVEICGMARSRRVTTVVDGPHAVAMLDLQLDQLGCDFYCASCHKWMCASLGSGFLWAHPRHHTRIQNPVISWGGSIGGLEATWQDQVNWPGTRDPASLLSISEAIRFWDEIGLGTLREHSHTLVTNARRRLLEIRGTGPMCTPTEDDYITMAAVELPQPSGWEGGYHGHPDPLQVELRKDHGIQIPVASWDGRRFIRISAHLYNTQDDIDRLVDAVGSAKNLR